MKAEVKKWLEALRSGEYEQGEILLRSLDDKYCCLGVACDLFKGEVGGWWEMRLKEFGFKVVGDDYVHVSGLGLDVAELLGIRGIQSSLVAFPMECDVSMLPLEVQSMLKLYPDNKSNLASLNDSGVSFEVIADFIEKNYDLIFETEETNE